MIRDYFQRKGGGSHWYVSFAIIMAAGVALLILAWIAQRAPARPPAKDGGEIAITREPIVVEMSPEARDMVPSWAGFFRTYDLVRGQADCPVAKGTLLHYARTKGTLEFPAGGESITVVFDEPDAGPEPRAGEKLKDGRPLREALDSALVEIGPYCKGVE